MKRIMLVALTLVLMSVPAVIYAQESQVVMAAVSFLQCDGFVIEASVTVVGYDGDGVVVPSFSGTLNAAISSGGGFSQTSVYTSGQSRTLYVAPGSPILFFDVYISAMNSRTDTYRIHCDGTIENLGTPLTGADGRLNVFHGDLLNVLYAATDTDGGAAIAVYSLDESYVGILEGYFTAADIAPFVADPPQQNTFIGQIAESSLYALTTGEFQINVGPDSEGKIYAMVFSGLPVDDVYFP
ncbi:MAG: hypothetical protein IPK52_25820 [Chloroflexi bacterium]|nr:hypothetical protein [Chloroflexota bacterium]